MYSPQVNVEKQAEPSVIARGANLKLLEKKTLLKKLAAFLVFCFRQKCIKSPWTSGNLLRKTACKFKKTNTFGLQSLTSWFYLQILVRQQTKGKESYQINVATSGKLFAHVRPRSNSENTSNAYPERGRSYVNAVHGVDLSENKTYPYFSNGQRMWLSAQMLGSRMITAERIGLSAASSDFRSAAVNRCEIVCIGALTFAVSLRSSASVPISFTDWDNCSVGASSWYS